MAIDRRSFLIGLGSAVGATLATAGHAADAPLYVTSVRGDDGAYGVAAFTADGTVRFRTRLPGRGHDAVRRPGTNEVIVFARRPGDWAAVVDLATGRVRKVILAPHGRHFYGHGAFVADGRIMHATENDMTTGQGVIGLYDAADDYRRTGELPSFGIGPHELAPRDRAGEIVIANGGIRTHPDSGREILNPDAMDPGLAVLDPRTGDCMLKADLGGDYRGLSIRHLAVASDGTTYFGCQFHGDPFDMPPLVGAMTPDGKTRFLDMPDEALASLDNYVGSVALDRSGDILAVTSPHGGMALFWDRASERYLGRRPMPDVCGLAAAAEPEAFILTSGNAGMGVTQVPFESLERFGSPDLSRWVWDNHVLVT